VAVATVVAAADEAVTAVDEAVTAVDEAAAAVAEATVVAAADEAVTAVEKAVAAVAEATVVNLVVNHSNLQTALAKVLVKVKPTEATTLPKAVTKVVLTESERFIPLLTPLQVPKRFHDLR